MAIGASSELPRCWGPQKNQCYYLLYLSAKNQIGSIRSFQQGIVATKISLIAQYSHMGTWILRRHHGTIGRVSALFSELDKPAVCQWQVSTTRTTCARRNSNIRAASAAACSSECWFNANILLPAFQSCLFASPLATIFQQFHFGQPYLHPPHPGGP